MGGLNSGSRAPKFTAQKGARGAANHRAKRPVVDETALAAAKAERERREQARRMAEPRMVVIVAAIVAGRVRIEKAFARVMAKRAARVAVPQTEQ
jgi:hypothetical protein